MPPNDNVHQVQNALNFTARLALLCEKHCPAVADFTGGLHLLQLVSALKKAALWQQ